jgi:hypothetical protein
VVLGDGLSISRSIVEVHRPNVGDSNEPRGTILVMLPI